MLQAAVTTSTTSRIVGLELEFMMLDACFFEIRLKTSSFHREAAAYRCQVRERCLMTAPFVQET